MFLCWIADHVLLILIGLIIFKFEWKFHSDKKDRKSNCLCRIWFYFSSSTLCLQVSHSWIEHRWLSSPREILNQPTILSGITLLMITFHSLIVSSSHSRLFTVCVETQKVFFDCINFSFFHSPVDVKLTAVVEQSKLRKLCCALLSKMFRNWHFSPSPFSNLYQ